MPGIWWCLVLIPGFALSLAGCVGLETAPPSGSTQRTPSSSAGPRASAPSGRWVDPQVAARVSRIMIPLLKAANKPRPLDQVKVGVLDDDSINAASAGSGEFYVTRGLLERANDEQLAAVLAHETAHDDLGHMAKAQALGTGVGIGAAILDQIIPGAGEIAPVAGTLITRAYGRREEFEADPTGWTSSAGPATPRKPWSGRSSG